MNKKTDKRFTFNSQQIAEPMRFDERWGDFPSQEEQEKDPQTIQKAVRIALDIPTGLRHIAQIEKSICAAIEAGAKTVESSDDGDMAVTLIGQAKQDVQSARERFNRLLSRHPDIDEDSLGWLCLKFFQLGNHMASHNLLTKYEQPINKGFHTKEQEQSRGIGKGISHQQTRELCCDIAQQEWDKNPLYSLESLAADIHEKLDGYEGIKNVKPSTIINYIRDLNPTRRGPRKLKVKT